MSDADRRRGDPEGRGIHWTRVSRGFYLVGIGTFFLLTTQDLLPASFWSEALAYWPVLLVAIGIRLLFERSPLPGLVLLGPFLVLGTLLWVALRGPGRAVPAGEWVPLRLDRPAGVSAWTFEGRLALADLDVASRGLPRGVLVQGRAAEAGRHSVRLTRGDAPGRVLVTNAWAGRSLVSLPGPRRARSELGVATSLPVAFDLDLTLCAARLDVAESPVSRVTFDGALNQVTLRLGRPSSEERLDVDGTLNNIQIEIPAGTPVAVTRDGFLNLIDQKSEKESGQAARDRGPGYRLRIDGAFNRVAVRPV